MYVYIYVAFEGKDLCGSAVSYIWSSVSVVAAEKTEGSTERCCSGARRGIFYSSQELERFGLVAPPLPRVQR